jgi:23S rRNA U2552 (ribose-2'-O)-methylase RlmE/FtsJ
MDIQRAEIAWERAQDALMDAADIEATRRDLLQEETANHIMAEWKNKTREQVMLDLYDWEFGGEYLIADIAQEMSRLTDKRGKVAFEALGEFVANKFQAAAYEQAKYEVQE